MIREYQDTDIEEILDIWAHSSSLAHPFLDADFMKQERKNIREVYIPNTKTWVFEQEGHLIGFIAMMKNEVGGLFVRPENHGCGIGKKMMDFVAQFHDELEVEVFEKNSIGRGFYNKYGFKLIREYVHKETNQKILRMKYNVKK